MVFGDAAERASVDCVQRGAKRSAECGARGYGVGVAVI